MTTLTHTYTTLHFTHRRTHAQKHTHTQTHTRTHTPHTSNTHTNTHTHPDEPRYLTVDEIKGIIAPPAYRLAAVRAWAEGENLVATVNPYGDFVTVTSYTYTNTLTVTF